MDMQCSQCGLCCKIFSFAPDNNAPKHVDKWFGEMTIIPIGYGKCPYLGDDNKCTVYKTRPEVCRNFNCWEHEMRVRYGCSFNKLVFDNAVRTGRNPADIVKEISEQFKQREVRDVDSK